MTIGTTGEHLRTGAASGQQHETGADGAGQLDVHLLAHTHWDREWYRPAVQFRQRLVHLVDDLLDRSPAPRFLLDGQAVIVEDYLAVRPERASELSARLRDGTVEAGPWYVLADELIPSGEALVRNLLAGRRVLRALRASPPGVLYCPDSFGHPAVLPAIAAGFGCAVIVLWRGYGGARWPAGDTARWRAADGSSALLYHLPPDGYETGSHLPLAPSDATLRWITLRATLAPRAVSGIVLLPAGADHHALPRDWPAMVAALSSAMDGDHLMSSSLGGFGEALRGRTAGRALPEVRGELRDSYGYTWTLQGTLGVRTALKRENARVERQLVRDTEPWLALARRRDGASRRALLDATWRALLLCHPHDTLCGCSIDEVAEAMTARLSEARSGAEALREEALDRLLGHDPATARGQAAAWRPAVVVRNRAARARSGVAEVTADLVLADEAVGPGSARQPGVPREARALSLGRPPVTLQLLDRARSLVREESPHHYPRTRLVERRRVLAWIDDVPACGLRVLPVEEVRRRPSFPRHPAAAREDGIDNGTIRLTVTDGAVTLNANGREIRDWLAIEAEGEQGDLYTHSAIPGSLVAARIRRSRVTGQGPLRAELTIDWELDVPERYVTSATGEGSLVAAARLPVRTILQLDAEASFARLLVQGDQRTTDVRLRLLVRTDVRAPRVVADAAFGPVERRPIEAPPEAQAMEFPDPAAPLHRYVSCFAASGGATLFGDGLTEYETDAGGTIAVTLTRSVGELSRRDLVERPGHAGYPAATPLAQARGPYTAGFAFLLHGPRTPATVDEIERVADDVLLPLEGHPWRTAVTPPSMVPGATLEGAGLACSAVKESEEGDWMVLRCVNLWDAPAAGAWHLPGLTEARLARLDETPLVVLPVEDGTVRFEAPPRGIVTLLVR
jgi:hypothetical protein